MEKSAVLYFVTIALAFTILVALLCVSVFAVIGIYMSDSAAESGKEVQKERQNCAAAAQTSSN